MGEAETKPGAAVFEEEKMGADSRKGVRSMNQEEKMKISGAAGGSEADKRTNADMDVEALVTLLDDCTRAGESRIKLEVVEGQGEVMAHQYHHGRCDIGSPWACGTAFDVLE